MSKFGIAVIDRLIHELASLPGVGRKSAQRLAFHIIEQDRSKAVALARAVMDAKNHLRECAVCFHFSEEETCAICRSGRRDRSTLCVVETSRDLIAIENTHEYKGLYHVLQGAVSPMEGVGKEDLRIDELVRRLKNEPIAELIIATNPTIEGDATALYIMKEIEKEGVQVEVTRIARGVPMGGDLEYADEVTLAKSLSGRRRM